MILGLFLANLGAICLDLGDTAKAVEHLREAAKVFDDLAEGGLTSADAITFQAANADTLAVALRFAGSLYEGLPYAEQAVRLLEHGRAHQRAQNPQLSIALAHLAAHYAAIGRTNEAIATGQRAVVVIRTAVDAQPADRRPVVMLAALATATSAAAMVLALVDPELALEPAQESVDLNRDLQQHGSFTVPLTESLCLLAELRTQLADPERASESLGEVWALVSAEDGSRPGLDPYVRILNALSRIGVLAGDPRAGEWASELIQVALTMEEDERPEFVLRGQIMRAYALSRRAIHHRDHRRPQQADSDATTAVAVLRQVGLPQTRPSLALALCDLSAVCWSAGDSDRAVAAAQEAAELARALADEDLGKLHTLAIASAALARTSPADATRIWNRAYRQLSNDNQRLKLLLERMALPEPIGPAACVSVLSWTRGAEPVHVVAVRRRVRAARAADPATFDQVWRDRTGGEPPDWLLVAFDLQRLLERWITRATIAEMFETHRQRVADLASPDIEMLLAEQESLGADLTRFHAILQATADHGIEQAYSRPRILELVSRLAAVTPAEWSANTEPFRELLAGPGAAAYVVEIDDGDALFALLGLVARGREQPVLACLQDIDDAVAMVDGVADDPELVELATRLLDELGQFTPHELDVLHVYRAVALAELGRLPEATALARQIVEHETLDPAPVRDLIIRRLENGAPVQSLLPFFRTEPGALITPAAPVHW